MQNCIAIIRIPPSADFALLKETVAGIPLLKRLALTLNRIGINDIILGESQFLAEDRSLFEKDMRADKRFKGNLIWLKKDQNPSQLDAIQGKHLLALNGNSLALKETLKDFIESGLSSEPFKNGEAVQMRGENHEAKPLFLFPSKNEEDFNLWMQTGGTINKTSPISVSSRAPVFLSIIESRIELKDAEWTFISLHRFHYRQIMDIWVNSFFSKYISAFLAKTNVTPNQISVAGLSVGLFSGYEFSRGDYLGGLFGGLLLAFTAIWDCCDGDIARLKFMESELGEKLDTICDNLINVFIFTGIMLGIARAEGWAHALIPFSLLALGGGSIFALIYMPGGGKGAAFKGTHVYDVVQLLASRNFIYVILLFAVIGKIEWFFWLAGFGSLAFALTLFRVKLKSRTLINN